MKHITRIFTLTILLLSILCSCSKGAFGDIFTDGEGSVHILGAVSDKADGTPLEGIKITFRYTESGMELSHTAYSGSDGTYIIRAEGLSGYIRGTVSASDEDGVYKESEIRIVNVTWQSESYDPQKNIFYINDIDFQLSK